MQKQISIDSIGHRIRELRQKRGLSQTDLAKLVGCAQNTITEWEKREGRAPGKKLLGKVAEALEVSIDYLLGIEKTQDAEIRCYGEVKTDGFEWQQENQYSVEVPQSEYIENSFCFRILDNLLEPVIPKGDYAIFEKRFPEDGDIVVLRYNSTNKGMIKRWRQQKNNVVLTEINLHELRTPNFYTIKRKKNSMICETIQAERFTVEGRLIMVKRTIKSITLYPKIKHIFF